MSCIQSLSLPRWFRGGLLFGLACLCVHAQQRDDERISQLKEQILAMDGVVQAAKNVSEKGRLEARQQRLRDELKILEERLAIEARQRALSENLRRSPIEALREKLRTVDVTAEEAEARVKDLITRRKAVNQARDALEEQLTALGGANRAAADALKVAEINEQIYTRNEELRALAFQREAAEFDIELARQAERLRERIKALDAGGSPTLKALFESYTDRNEARKISDQLSPRFANLEQSKQIGESALTLGQQKLAKFDEELALLDKQTSFFSNNPKVEQLLSAQRNQKKAIAERLVFTAAQVAAIKSSEDTLSVRRELGSLDLAVLEEQFATLKDAYLERMRWPAAVLLGLIALFMTVSLLVLPLIYKNESLFLARRLTRYITIVLAVGAVASFMFDDLSMVAATMGIVSAALVIALQEAVTSAFGWFVIMMGSKFGIGDRLEIDGTRGDVIDIQLLRTTLVEVNGWLGVDEPTGRIILVPNNFIFNNKIFNYTHGHPFVWGKIDVTVGFNCAEAAAALFQRVLMEETKDEFAAARTAAQRMRRRYGVDDATYEPRVTSAIAGNDVAFTLFYVAHYRRFSDIRNRIDHRLIEELTRYPDIKLAVTSIQVSHDNPVPTAPALQQVGPTTVLPILPKGASVAPSIPPDTMG
ncbi:MAG: mechanosensitive ion channel [Opitutaceae bacterium]|nr:mechanosensitive ion channel [Opitutaceae bacterium]